MDSPAYHFRVQQRGRSASLFPSPRARGITKVRVREGGQFRGISKIGRLESALWESDISFALRRRALMSGPWRARLGEVLSDQADRLSRLRRWSRFLPRPAADASPVHCLAACLNGFALPADASWASEAASTGTRASDTEKNAVERSGNMGADEHVPLGRVHISSAVVKACEEFGRLRSSADGAGSRQDMQSGDQINKEPVSEEWEKLAQACAAGMKDLLSKGDSLPFEEVFSLQFYGLKPEGVSELHDWAYETLLCQTPPRRRSCANREKVVSVTPAILSSTRYACIEADASYLPLKDADVLLAERRLLRAMKEYIENTVQLCAALDGYSRMKPAKVERLKVSVHRLEQNIERARLRLSEAEERLSRRTEAELKKAERTSRMEERRKNVEKEKERKARKADQQRKQQASFLQSFLRRSTDRTALPSTGDPGAGTVKPVANKGVDVDNNAGNGSGIQVTPFDLSSARCSVPEPAWTSWLASVSNGLPVFENPDFMPVSRWLLCSVPFASCEEIERAIEESYEAPRGQSEARSDRLADLMHEARQKRKSGERMVRRVLPEYVRSSSGKTHLQHNTPRFSTRRADVRGTVSGLPVKLLQFDDDVRPAFVGTRRQRSAQVSARRPWQKDATVDYEYDSEADWEDGDEHGEELSDDDKDRDLEIVELKQLGMFGSDTESDDDDFLDDDNVEHADENGTESDLEIVPAEELETPVRPEQGETLPKHDSALHSQEGGPVAMREKRQGPGPDGGQEIPIRKRRRVGPVLKRPRVQIYGPVFDASPDDRVLGRFPVRRVSATASIGLSDPCVAEVDTFGCTSTTTRDEASKPKRGVTKMTGKKVSSLTPSELEELTSLVQGNAKRKGALVDEFVESRRKRSIRPPSKAEVSRAVDAVAFRKKGKNQRWTLRSAAAESEPIAVSGTEKEGADGDGGCLSGTSPTSSPHTENTGTCCGKTSAD